MKVASIVPTAYLHLTKDDDYFMALAHLVGVDKQYTQFFKERTDEGKFVLMDNGVVEGEQQNVKELIRRGKLINATEVILPDTISNGPETIMKSYEALPKLSEYFKVMIVPQGCNVTEWHNCAETMLRWKGIHSIGITKFILNAASDGRDRCINLAWPRLGDLEVHLLGVYREASEVNTLSVKHPFIRGVDSSAPYAFAKNREVMDFNTAKPDVKIDFEDTHVDELLLKKNIGIWRSVTFGDM